MRWGWKIPLFWLLGGLCMLLGSMVAGSLQRSLGVAESDFLIGLVSALILFLVGGMLWIAVAVAAKSRL
jgi:hypothetical protein